MSRSRLRGAGPIGWAAALALAALAVVAIVFQLGWPNELLPGPTRP